MPHGDLLVLVPGQGRAPPDDVAVFRARLRKGAERWSEPFLMADTPGFPDCNTTMFIDSQHRSGSLAGVLANTWESCLTNYRIARVPRRGAAQMGLAGRAFISAPGL